MIDPNRIRKVILERSYATGTGHIGCSLSVAEIVASMIEAYFSLDTLEKPDRNRIVLSKGHAALAYYAGLNLIGALGDEELAEYLVDGTSLGVHPDRSVPGIDFSTGSLGMGFTFAAGAALAARLDGSARRVVALLSDGECNEGSIWETALFASHRNLGNLLAIVDLNGQQALGNTEEILSMHPFAEKWRAFGWTVYEVDGHDAEEILRLMTEHKSESAEAPPTILIAKTTFGKGVSYMENQVEWHYRPMNSSQYETAIQEVSR
tara:strand:- start:5042 stop:5833 length:792 start_codon:yes stop_codon:yes gene_type:complete